MDVTAVIPNWNGKDRLLRVLADLHAQTERPRETIVVDNGSTDSSSDAAAQWGARIIQFTTNRGFAAAVNAGVAAARSPYVAILNNDLEIPPDWLSRIASAITQTPASFAVGKLLSAADHRMIDGSFDAICRGGAAWRCGQGRVDGPVWSQPRIVRFPPFTAIVIRTEVFRGLGGLDEDLESYLEDVEFGLRCASKGHTGIYVPEAIAYHAGSSTLGFWSPRTVRLIARNQLLIVARHYPTGLLIRFGWPLAVAQLLWGLVALRHGAGLAWSFGKFDGLRLFPSCRRQGNDGLAPILGSSERELLELQRQTGWDWYWRIYSALTSCGKT